MKKLIHVLNINDFFPELFALTFPTIQAYAERHGFQINPVSYTHLTLPTILRV